MFKKDWANYETSSDVQAIPSFLIYSSVLHGMLLMLPISKTQSKCKGVALKWGAFFSKSNHDDFISSIYILTSYPQFQTCRVVYRLSAHLEKTSGARK